MKAGTMRRAALIIALPVALFSLPLLHLADSAWKDRADDLPVAGPGFADDASHLNRTAVAEVIDISPDEQVAVQQVRSAFDRAREKHITVSIAGARHSMGGQTIARGGIVLNMLKHDHTRYDRRTKNVVVGAGAMWDLVIPYLDHFGRAVEVMQSDSPFSVGGSLSVNCHGWQPARPPIVSTIEAFTIVTPDGALRRCSRSQNPELFSAVAGGLGLFGVVLDVELRTVANEQYRRETVSVKSENFTEELRRRIGNDVGLAYGRLSIAPARFLSEGLITTYHRVPGEPKPLEWHEPSKLERWLFRGSLRSDFGKSVRWWAEKHLSRFEGDDVVSRNELMDADTALYLNRSSRERDILQEYFVPPDQLSGFIGELRVAIRRRNAELLNVTVRDVRRDDTAQLRYAREDMIAVVLFLSQRPDATDEAMMRSLTEELIDAALARRGTYYLPYRLHASPAQFRRSYPECGAFFALKRRYDPGELLQNEWYRTYGRACDAGPLPLDAVATTARR